MLHLFSPLCFIIGEIRGVHKLRWQEFAQVLALVITVSLKNKNGKYTNGSTTKPNYWPPIYYPPPVDIFQEILHPRENLHKVEIFSTTHLPCLVHVVCECPKWNYFNKRTFFQKESLLLKSLILYIYKLAKLKKFRPDLTSLLLYIFF